MKYIEIIFATFIFLFAPVSAINAGNMARTNNLGLSIPLWVHLLIYFGIIIFTIGLLYIVYHRRMKSKNSAIYKTLQLLQHKEGEINLSKDRIFDDELSHEEIVYRNLCKMMNEDKLYTTQISQKDLAECLGTSIVQLNNAVKHYADGMNLEEYVNRYRLRYAAAMLTQRPDLPAIAAGEEAGFSSKNIYQTLFTEYFGMSPNEYRNISKSRSLEKAHKASFSKHPSSSLPNFLMQAKNLF